MLRVWVFAGLMLVALGPFAVLQLREVWDRPPVVALDIPDWREECLPLYGDQSRELWPLFEAGDRHAELCTIALEQGLSRAELASARTFRAYYTIYTRDGIEPEGLDAIVRSHDRQELAIGISLAHRFSEVLPPLEFSRLDGSCYVYPPRARQLLRRAPLRTEWECGLPRF